MSFDWGRYLEDGEEVLWEGRPDRRFRLFLTDWDVWIVPMFMIFFLVLPLTAVMVPATLPFLLVCTYVLFGRSIIDMRRRRRFRYAITNSRVLRRSNDNPPELLATIATAPALDVTLGRFTSIRFNRWQRGKPRPVLYGPFIIPLAEAYLFGYVEKCPELRLIPDGKEVVRLLKSLISDAKEAAE